MTPFLPWDDLPPEQLGMDDRDLRRQLDLSLTQRYREQCNSELQTLLNACAWAITTTTNVVTLVIVCPDSITNWKVLSHIVTLGTGLAEFSTDARIRIYSTPEMLDQFEIRVDELSIYQDGA
jgi:hypothetical protein